MKILRDYQELATQATFDYFEKKSGNPLVVAPVGAGKSLLMAEFIRRACLMFPDTRFIVLSHDSRLLTQDAAELLGQWPEADISFYSDKLGHKNLSGQVIYAGIQSIYKRAFEIRGTIDLVLVDECHLISPENDTMYRRFLDDLRRASPHVKVIGYTGTPFRAGKGFLHRGDNPLFTDIAYEIPMTRLIEEGHLCPVFTPPMKTQMDTSSVPERGGDFVPGQLARAVDKDEITRACVAEIVEHGRLRRKWLIFAAGVEHAEHIRDVIREHGITCEAVHSKLSTGEQDAILKAYEGDGLRCLVNVAQLTTGFNNPAIDLLAFMRPTRSPVLYIQCCGRAMRTHQGKKDAVVLDFGGVVEALGPVDRIEIADRKKRAPGEKSAAPMKECPECKSEIIAGLRTCPECDHEFPANQTSLSANASGAAILSSQIKPKKVQVYKVAYYRHIKAGKRDSLRVEYLCGVSSHSEWIHFERSGQLRVQAAWWWAKRMPGSRTPNTVAEALELAPSLPVPTHIEVKKVGKFWEIVGYEFGEASQPTDSVKAG
ncbi:DEAD/DEAH box helicase family protein [Tundrisphaera sp. TA3]|uniref:DEAD/DEAH box helicase n=1 Tax=Tundrisphaera sp. TA3 TaxID=3435775 RepID=UPI003EB7554E